MTNNENLHEEHSCGGSCGCGGHDHDSEHGCGGNCGCGDQEVEVFTVDLEDENGNIVQCEIVDSFEYKNAPYVVVQNPQDDAVYLFKVVGEGEEGELVIPDDEEFEEVSSFYESSMDTEE